jgi:hypothetical protein
MEYNQKVLAVLAKYGFTVQAQGDTSSLDYRVNLLMKGNPTPIFAGCIAELANNIIEKVPALTIAKELKQLEDAEFSKPFVWDAKSLLNSFAR